MRTLSSTLTAAGKSDSRVPYVQALFDDYDGDRPRMRWSQYYAGSEADNYSACVVSSGDGSLLRARYDAGNLYVSRVASPTSSSTYSSWTNLNAAAAAQMAFIDLGSGSVLLFYVAVGGLQIVLKISADNGATWGVAINLALGLATITNLCAAAAGAGDWHVIWSEGANVCWLESAAAGTRHVWTNTVNAVTGLAVVVSGDFCVVVTGRETGSTDYKVWTCFFGYGLNAAVHTWTALVEVAGAATASGVGFVLPAVTYLSCWWLFFREDYVGTAVYSRGQWASMDGSETFTNEKWREPQALRQPSGGYFSVASSGTALWLCTSFSVWYAPLNLAQLDLSERVLECDVSLEAFKGRARLLLDNADGQIARGTSSGLQIVPGRRVQLTFGYRTSAGVEVAGGGGTGPAYWVDSVEWIHRNDGRAVVEVIAFDAWRYLEAWVARREFVFAAGARLISQLLAFVFGRAGLSYAALTNSAALTALSPAYAIHAGEDGLTAVKALLAQVPDKVIMRTGGAKNLYPQSSDSSGYSFGTDHAIVAGSYRLVASRVTRARAFGPGLLLNERFDLQDAEDLGERVAQLLDVNLTTSTLAGNRADYMLREADYGQEADELTVALLPGLEIYDVVDVTDVGAGLAAAKRRVRSLAFKHRAGMRGRPVFELAITLSAV